MNTINRLNCYDSIIKMCMSDSDEDFNKSNINFWKQIEEIDNEQNKLGDIFLKSLDDSLKGSRADHLKRLNQIDDTFTRETKKLQKKRMALHNQRLMELEEIREQREINLNKRKVDEYSDIDKDVCMKKKKVD